MVRRGFLLTFFCFSTILGFAQVPHSRHFRLTYAFSVRAPQLGKPLRIWFPIAVSDQWQKVKILSIKSDLPLHRTREAEYGDYMFYAFTRTASRSRYDFKVVYDVTRFERFGLQNGVPVKGGPEISEASKKRFLQPDRLVPVTGLPAELAARVSSRASTPLERARAIYKYVLRTMRYDKSGTGWGRGDALWACNAKRGNCTDFHSLFAAMARSQGIPVRFAIGLPLPADRQDGRIPGYHCWVDFFAEDSWIPIDISEAWQHPSKAEYFFGAHDENRVQFSVGRDITLNPRQQGPPLNYFVYPYVESGGTRYANVSNDFSFSDLPNVPNSRVRAGRSHKRGVRAAGTHGVPTAVMARRTRIK